MSKDKIKDQNNKFSIGEILRIAERIEMLESGVPLRGTVKHNDKTQQVSFTDKEKAFIKERIEKFFTKKGSDTGYGKEIRAKFESISPLSKTREMLRLKEQVLGEKTTEIERGIRSYIFTSALLSDESWFIDNINNNSIIETISSLFPEGSNTKKVKEIQQFLGRVADGNSSQPIHDIIANMNVPTEAKWNNEDKKQWVELIKEDRKFLRLLGRADEIGKIVKSIEAKEAAEEKIRRNWEKKQAKKNKASSIADADHKEVKGEETKKAKNKLYKKTISQFSKIAYPTSESDIANAREEQKEAMRDFLTICLERAVHLPSYNEAMSVFRELNRKIKDKEEKGEEYKKNIPDVIIDGNSKEVIELYGDSFSNYYMRMLPIGDARGFILGHETGCCQSIDNNARRVALDGMINDDAGFYVIFKKSKPGKIDIAKDRMLGQSYGWLGQDTANGGKSLVLDSWERKGKDNNKLFEVFYSRFASIAQKEHQIAKITLGAGGNTPNLNSFDIETQPTEPKGERLYGDSIRQYTIADRERGIESEDLQRMIKRKIILGIPPKDIENDYVKLNHGSKSEEDLRAEILEYIIDYTAKYAVKSYSKLFDNEMIDLDKIAENSEGKYSDYLFGKLKDTDPSKFIRGNLSFDICKAALASGNVEKAKKYIQYLNIEKADTKNVTEFLKILGKNNQQLFIDKLSYLENISPQSLGKLLEAAIKSGQKPIIEKIMTSPNVEYMNGDSIEKCFESALKNKQYDLVKEIIKFPNAKYMNGYIMGNIVQIALFVDQFNLAREILKFSNAKEMNGDLIGHCVSLAFYNDQLDLAKEILKFPNIMNIENNFIKVCFAVALIDNQYDLAKEILKFPNAKYMKSDDIRYCFIEALKNNQLGLVKEILKIPNAKEILKFPNVNIEEMSKGISGSSIAASLNEILESKEENLISLAEEMVKFPNAKDMNSDLIAKCFTTALRNNQSDIAKEVLYLYNGKDVNFSSIKICLSAALSLNQLELAKEILEFSYAKEMSFYSLAECFKIAVKYKHYDLAEEIIGFPNAKEMSMSSAKSCLSLALKNDQILTADKLLVFPAIKKGDSDCLKSICTTIINNDKLHPALLKKALNHDKIKSDINFLNDLKSDSVSKGKTEASEIVQSFIDKAVKNAAKDIIKDNLANVLSSIHDLPVAGKTSLTQKLKDQSNLKKDNMRTP